MRVGVGFVGVWWVGFDGLVLLGWARIEGFRWLIEGLRGCFGVTGGCFGARGSCFGGRGCVEGVKTLIFLLMGDDRFG